MLERLDQLGFITKQFREAASLTQEELQKKCGRAVSRTAIALLEQGRRLPPPNVLEIIAGVLGLPKAVWEAFAREESSQRQELEAVLGELVGRPVALRMLHVESVHSAEATIAYLFGADLTLRQAYDTLNSILVYYAIPKMEWSFFERYFTSGAFQSVEAFSAAVIMYQEEAIRLFSTFSEAYRTMNSGAKLTALLAPLAPRELEAYVNRTAWESTNPHDPKSRISQIEESRLPFLGYISVSRYREQKKKREVLAKYLRELAVELREHGREAVEELSIKRRRSLDSLLRELDSTLQHTPISPLFAPNPAELEAEAARVLRDEADVEEMARTQSEALKNLSNYVSADFMDVYVATSMRSESDFVSVNRFATRLFRHQDVAPLRLRYFNPTQSWIEDRVAKGLVEALMLRRADYTIYMAQKGDTFGKDSEASVALGQGKPVIVYVPKLSFKGVDSESLFREADSALRRRLQAASDTSDDDLDDTLDHNGLYAEVIGLELENLDDEQLSEVVRNHWPDFGLLDESERIRGKNETTIRDDYSRWLRQVMSLKEDDPLPVPIVDHVRTNVIRILTALTVNFEKRAAVFREVHPLALQVILSTGVLNGILVTRSVSSCARILRQLIENKLDLELRTEPENYRLVERSTGSTIRVISRNNLLVNAFDAFYSRLEEEQ